MNSPVPGSYYSAQKLYHHVDLGLAAFNFSVSSDLRQNGSARQRSPSRGGTIGRVTRTVNTDSSFAVDPVPAKGHVEHRQPVGCRSFCSGVQPNALQRTLPCESWGLKRTGAHSRGRTRRFFLGPRTQEAGAGVTETLRGAARSAIFVISSCKPAARCMNWKRKSRSLMICAISRKLKPCSC